MKTTKLVNTFFKKQVHLLLSILQKKESSFSENDFHSIRIAIKKIKALFTLVEKSNASFHQKKYFAPFKIVFEHAGEIRDKEVIQSILHAHPYNASIESFEFDLHQHINKEKKQFFKITTSALRKDIRHSQEKVSRFFNKINRKKAEKFLQKKKKAIYTLLIKDQLNPDHLHEIRKRIKDVYYVQKMIEPKNREMTGTDQLQELLGQWHDGRVLLQELNAYLNSKNLQAKDKAPYESLKTKMAIENENLFRLILEQKPALLKLFA